MATERPNPRDIDTRIETLDEPTGTIEFGPPLREPPKPDTMGEDQKPGSSSNLGGNENAAVRKAELRQRQAHPGIGRRWRSLWRRLSGQSI